MRLSRLPLAAALVALCLPAARAEVKVMLRMEHASCLQFEAMNAFMKILNDDSLPLVLGSGSNGTAELFFNIGQKPDEWLPKTSSAPMLSGLMFSGGEQRDVAIDLARWYDVAAVGRYFVRAIVRVGDVYYDSPPTIVDVVRGIEVEKLSREVVGYPGVVRTYSLRSWPRERFDYLFLSVEEKPEGTNLGVFQLGKLLRVAPPKLDVDRHGNVMVLHQSAQDCFIRTFFKSDGEGVQFVDQSYELPTGEPYPAPPAGIKAPPDFRAKP